MPNTWVQALKQFNNANRDKKLASNSFTVPSKGTKQYNQVMAIKKKLDKK